jgi:hypothetical protein
MADLGIPLRQRRDDREGEAVLYGLVGLAGEDPGCVEERVEWIDTATVQEVDEASVVVSGVQRGLTDELDQEQAAFE